MRKRPYDANSTIGVILREHNDFNRRLPGIPESLIEPKQRTHKPKRHPRPNNLRFVRSLIRDERIRARGLVHQILVVEFKHRAR
jgi:hypothetical protein